MLYPLSYEGGYRSLREGGNRLFYGTFCQGHHGPHLPS
jgi:hypothetical protein